jgi:hypothetical protein
LHSQLAPGVPDGHDSGRTLHRSGASSVHGASGTTWSIEEQVQPEATAESTFDDLFSDHHERLYRALYLIVGNSHEAEELMQDAFVKVLERWEASTTRPGTCPAPTCRSD